MVNDSYQPMVTSFCILLDFFRLIKQQMKNIICHFAVDYPTLLIGQNVTYINIVLFTYLEFSWYIFHRAKTKKGAKAIWGCQL